MLTTLYIKQTASNLCKNLQKYIILGAANLKPTTGLDFKGKMEAAEVDRSVRWRPSARASLRCAPLVGIGGDSPAAEFRFNFEWEF